MSNITQNLLDLTLDQATLTSIKDHITAIEAVLPSKGLTPDQRKKYRSLDVRNLGFVQDVVKVKNNIDASALLPTILQNDNIDNDLVLFKQVNELRSRLLQLVSLLTDIERIVAHEAYSNALAYYKMFQMGAKVGAPNAQTALEQLAWRFKNHAKKDKTKSGPKGNA